MQSTYTDSSDSRARVNSRFVPVKVLRGVGDYTEDYLARALDAKLIGKSELMQALKRSIRIVARSEETVLITGESGTGKELIARAIHDLSERRDHPFLPVNCGALTESLLESELFGHVKGSFTGAISNKKGFFEAANGGTIFLDEFAELSLAMQQRLLRVLQEGRVRPVGSTHAKEIEIDSRVVVATNHDLKQDVLEGTFRKDLYYRVNVLEINAPALRHRQDDILELVQHIIRKYNEKYDRQLREQVTPDVLSILKGYSWPGNVRELENITKRLAVSAEDQAIITQENLSTIPEINQLATAVLFHPSESIKQHQASDSFSCPRIKTEEQHQCPCSRELDLYRSSINQARGNVSEAARLLNIPRSSLRKRLRILTKRCGP